MEPIFIKQFEDVYWRQRNRMRPGSPQHRRVAPPGYYVEGRHHPTAREIRNLVSNTERYLAWRRDFPSEQAIEAQDCSDLIERARAGGWITPDDSEMPQDDSEDSYSYFIRRKREWKRTTNGEGIR